jgi:hypothetical protein
MEALDLFELVNINYKELKDCISVLDDELYLQKGSGLLNFDTMVSYRQLSIFQSIILTQISR